MHVTSDRKAYLFGGPPLPAVSGFLVDLGLPLRLGDSGSPVDRRDSRHALNVTHFEFVLGLG
jgi:hypothetical protein